MFPERLKELRTEKNLTQAEAAKNLNVTQGTIALWESGKRTPDIKKVHKIANYFDVSISWLIGEGKNRKLINSKINPKYLKLAKKAQDEKIQPADIQLVLKMMKERKQKNNSDDKPNKIS